ncbi:hypothetical protein [Acidicapsa ligni]|uniref:hypothetical protein n=1 Tax=Acidicapsa ligni TaxID=542300 RepID=UPI0021E0ED96|nr:hypothetical protein [Acidicapsa ligni]
MNAVEIEAVVSELAAQPFDAAEFPFQFLAAFYKKETTLKPCVRVTRTRAMSPARCCWLTIST